MIMTYRRFQWLALLAMALLLSGCASTFNSKVTTFHDWTTGAAPGERTYQFAPTPAQTNDLEYKNYEDLLRLELGGWGFTEAINSHPKFLISANYKVDSRTEKIRETRPDPFMYSPFYGYGGFYGGGYGRRRPFFYYPPPVAYQSIERDVQVFTKRLTLTIFDAGAQKSLGKKRYEVTAVNESGREDLAPAMPYLIRSALSDFPGNNGQVRDVRIELPKQ